MTPHERYGRWLEECEDDELRKQLEELGDGGDDLIEARFSTQLELGLDGLVGELGPSSCQINSISLGRLVQAYASELKARSRHVVVAIACDTHAEATFLAQDCAGVLAANGIDCQMFDEPTPLPLLSYAVRELACDAGIYVGGGSQNAAFCGIRLLSASGASLSMQAVREVNEAARGLDELDDVRRIGMDSARTLGRIRQIDSRIFDEYLDAVMAQGLEQAGDKTCRLDVTLTTLNGAALPALTSVFDRLGLGRIAYVPEQTTPDSSFATCNPPDPNSPSSLGAAFNRCEEASSDILIACDPEGRRLGVAIRENARYRLLADSELASLLIDYVCRMRELQGEQTLGTIILGACGIAPLAEAIAGERGVVVERCLPYVAQGAEQLDRLAGRSRDGRMTLGFFGDGLFFVGSHCREADAIAAATLVCQMARNAKRAGTTLAEQLEWMSYTHGHRAERILSIPFAGPEAISVRAGVLASLRSQPPASFAGGAIERIDDYLAEDCPYGSCDMIGIVLEDGSEVLILPHGSKPELTVRLLARGHTHARAEERAASLEGAARFLVAGRM